MALRTLSFLTAALAVLSCSRDLQLPPLPTPGTVYGRVVYAVAGQNQPVPAAGASVALLGTSLSTTTGADGRFLLGGIIESQGTLLFRIDTQGTGTFDRQRIIGLADVGAGLGRQIGLGDVPVGENAQMHGRVILGDRTGQPGGQGGTVIFVPAAPYTAYSNDDGTWTLNNLPEGPVALSLFHAAYQPATVDTLTLRSSEDFGVRDLVLAPAPGSQQPGTIAGTVAFVPALSSANGTVLTALSTAANPVQGTAQANGSFQLTGLAPGLYSVSAAHDGYATASVPNVLVEPGIENTLPVIVLGVGLSDGGSFGDGGGPQPNGLTANAGAPGAVRAGGTYTLNGSGSTSPGGPLLFQWAQTAGAPVVLSVNGSVLASRPSFTAPATPQNLDFALTVTSAGGRSATSYTQVAVALPPVARVTPALLTLYPGERASLDATASSDPSGAPLTFAWTEPTGSAGLSADGGPGALVSAATSSGTSTVQLVVSNGFLSSDPVEVPVVTGAPATITVSVGPDQFVGAGSVVLLSATGHSTDPNDTFTFQWTQQDGGVPVSLVQANTATPSFVAPLAPTALSFGVTATANSGGSAVSAVSVQVEDFSAPVIIHMDPAFDGGTGSPLYARATFDRALDPATVTAANIQILDGTSAVKADLSYDAATHSITVLPRSPLVVGRSYAFRVGAVTDSRGVAHIPVAVDYTVASPNWTYWTSTVSTWSFAPYPGLAVAQGKAYVFGYRYQYGICGYGTWVMNPNADGGLDDQPLCLSLNTLPDPTGRKGFVVNGSVWGYMGVANGGLFQQEGSNWSGVPVVSSDIATDGLTLFGTYENNGLNFASYDPGCANSWCSELVDSSIGTYDKGYMSAAGGAGRLFAVGAKGDAGSAELMVFERGDAGTWSKLTGGSANGGVDTSQALFPNRAVYVHGDPFVVYAPQAGLSQVSAAAWSSASRSWTLYSASGGSAGSDFDVVGRGDTVYVAEVLAGQLRVRRLDLGAPSPVFEDVLGPNGPALNTCTAGHPELSITDDSLWVTWHEGCVLNQWQVYLAQLH